ncbi:glycosyltransferase family 4 protein [Pseudanabaena sp. ABRG5-3]|uniref:glycosyltransferase family 4 protein n=1 Tax=Pseudanabaena sp. ABRG5-3 TaxID=685565 RepID=UPI000DC6E453|nr:glycosyltransferase family 4 protein [Pseudanabaena sp. ABRG5-3]BBC24546.1 glycosyl transferase group 1 family protein [Pseudanabaena sp. ABRG5-3]
MRLCIVTHNIIKGDGQGRANYEIVLEAIRRGYHVTLVAINVSPELQQNSQVKWVPISVKGFPTALLSNLVFTWQSRHWLHQHHHEFDLLQVYGCVTDYPADVNTFQFVHSGWLRSPAHTWRLQKNLYGAYQWLFTALNAHWEKKACQISKILVAVSEGIKQELIDIGMDQKKIHVILNGVDIEEFVPAVRERSQFSLPEKVTLALFAGDIRTNRKNLDTVLHGLVHVPDLHLAVVGNVTKSPYPQLASQLGLSERVHFLGYRRDIAEIMKAADFFVFPSRYEPFGMVVSEAMATGLPVITTAISGVAEIVTPESGVVLNDSEDVIALADAMAKLASDRNLRLQMGQVARAIAEQHSWKSKAKIYVDLFEELHQGKV